MLSSPEGILVVKYVFDRSGIASIPVDILCWWNVDDKMLKMMLQHSVLDMNIRGIFSKSFTVQNYSIG